MKDLAVVLIHLYLETFLANIIFFFISYEENVSQEHDNTSKIFVYPSV